MLVLSLLRMDRVEAMSNKLSLTQSERSTYMALRARGYSHDDALEDALDGVHVDDVRNPSRKEKR